MTNADEKEINLQVLMENVLERLSIEPSAKPVAVVMEYPAHIPPISADEDAIAGLIGDLVRSVLTWTDRQEVRIQARVIPGDELPVDALEEVPAEAGRSGQGLWALLSITDEHAHRIPGVSLSDYEKPSDQEQLGFERTIGERAAQVGGHAWLQHIGEQGSSIKIALPLQEPEVLEPDVSRVREKIETRLSSGEEAGTKLLMQVTNADVRDLLVEDLLAGGYQVINADTASDVLGLAQLEKPDLIILDLQARKPTAIDLALLLRQTPGSSSIPVLFLTEIIGPGIGRRMETVDLLVRPGGVSAVLQTVNSVLGSGIKPTARIMVVESDNTLRESTLATLQKEGYPVVEARSEEEALALAERVAIGVVLVNTDLAQARDYWLVRQLRQLSREIEIYLMTEGPPALDTRQALLRGATGFGDTGRLRDLLDRMVDDGDREED